MDDKKFWEIVDKSIANVDSGRLMAKQLAQNLDQLKPDEIRAFDAIKSRFKAIAYKSELYGAAQLLAGSTLSDDYFEGFTCWLITRGSKAYEAALKNPDTLVEQTMVASAEKGIDVFWGDFCAVPYYLYKELTGKKMTFDHDSYGNPPDPHAMTGFPLTIDELKSNYPTLWEKFGHLQAKKAQEEKGHKPNEAELAKTRKQEEENEKLRNEIHEKERDGKTSKEELAELERKRLEKMVREASERAPESHRLTEKQINEMVRALMGEEEDNFLEHIGYKPTKGKNNSP